MPHRNESRIRCRPKRGLVSLRSALHPAKLNIRPRRHSGRDARMRSPGRCWWNKTPRDTVLVAGTDASRLSRGTLLQQLFCPRDRMDVSYNHLQSVTKSVTLQGAGRQQGGVNDLRYLPESMGAQSRFPARDCAQSLSTRQAVQRGRSRSVSARHERTHQRDTMGRTCAISQPTFLPWSGWFDLVDQSDVMVLLDDVQFAKRSWQQRNRVRTAGGLEFLSVPVKVSGRFEQRIIDCKLADDRFVTKALGTLQTNYARAPYFTESIQDLARSLKFAASTASLLELNCELIAWMAAKLGVTKPMIRASALGTTGRRGEHLAELCEAVEADHYVSPAGAEAYLTEDRSAFDRRGIVISIQVYEHPEYQQCFTPFMPYATALDLIFNAGPRAGEIMRAGRRPARPIAKSAAEVTPWHGLLGG
jgi:hypothetical protein